jgi:hypothetical protein
MRCQQYGDSKSYCNRLYVCVKCGGSHSTNCCKKSKDTPATYALCGGSHTANYKGCEYYQTLVQKHNVHTTSGRIPFITNEAPPIHSPTSSQHLRSYANVASNNMDTTDLPQDTKTVLTHFLNESKSMFNQIIQQHSMILNLLTSLLSKLNKSG